MKKLIVFVICCLMSLPHLAQAYSIAHINLGYGKLDVSSGGGWLNVGVDKDNKLTRISIDVSAGMFGVNEDIKETMSINELLSGKTMNFYMSGAIEPVLKITPLAGFSKNGGKVKFSVRKSDGFYYEIIEIARGSKTQDFYIWKGNEIIEEIAVNMRGGKAATMYVGWYELVTE
jgi:hypothetical protein